MSPDQETDLLTKSDLDDRPYELTDLVVDV